MIIKKLNSLFHKHSRLLFGLFTVLIIFAFTDFLTPGRNGGCDSQGSGDVGTAFGKKVSIGDMVEFQRNLALSLTLQGARINDLPINTELFNHYCLIEKAKQLGLTATEKDIAAKLATLPLFQKDGKFDLATYQDFLKRNRLKEKNISEALSITVLFEKLNTMLPTLATVTDSEVEALYRATGGGFELKVCRFNAVKGSEPTEEKLKAYYEANKAKKYVAPGRFKALLAELPFSAFNAEAEKAVTAADVKKAAESGMFNGPDGKPQSDAVIRKELVRFKAAELAQKPARKSYREIYDLLFAKQSAPAAEQLKIFRKWAADRKLVVIETGYVEFGKTIPGRGMENLCREFQSMPASGLILAGIEAGEKSICIGVLQERIDPRQREYKEVASAVRADFIAEQQLTLTRKFAYGQAAALSKKDKAAAAKDFDKLPGTFVEFKFPPSEKNQLKPEEIQLAYALSPALRDLAAGEVSGAVDLPNGAAIVKVVKRTPADMAKFAAQKEFFKTQLLMMKRQQVMQQFMEDIARNCRCTLPETRNAE